MTVGNAVDAGGFSAWLVAMMAALRGERGSDVPCGACTACCTSSQFIHIEPDETDTLAHMPVELLFAAPKRPVGHRVMGFDDHGCCPMLVDHRCSIYDHRPRTCRVYDCRVFAASGLTIDDSAKRLIAAQVARWSFQFPSDDDGEDFRSVRRAAAYLSAHAPDYEEEFGVLSATELAVLSIELYQLFTGHHGAGEQPSDVPGLPTAVRVVLRGRVE